MVILGKGLWLGLIYSHISTTSVALCGLGFGQMYHKRMVRKIVIIGDMKIKITLTQLLFKTYFWLLIGRFVHQMPFLIGIVT